MSWIVYEVVDGVGTYYCPVIAYRMGDVPVMDLTRKVFIHE